MRSMCTSVELLIIRWSLTILADGFIGAEFFFEFDLSAMVKWMNKLYNWSWRFHELFILVCSFFFLHLNLVFFSHVLQMLII
jgi:hypothetical protein